MTIGQKCNNAEHTERYVNGRCKECARISRGKHYYNNKKPYLNRAKKVKKAMREYVRSLKKECSDCNKVYPPFVLDFHHLEGKVETIGEAVRRGSWPKLLAEIDKCIIICANCHRIRHYSLDKSF